MNSKLTETSDGRVTPDSAIRKQATPKPHSLAAFSDMPVAKAVRIQCVPAVISQLVVLLYNLADAYFIGHLGQPHVLAGIAVVTPVVLLLTAIGNLPAVGGGTCISAALGRKDTDGAKRFSSATIIMTAAIAALFTVAYFFFGDYLLYLAGATDSTIGPAHEYAFWVVTMDAFPIITGLALSYMVRAEGMARQASIGISAGALLNVILDPLLISPHIANMGIAGAGIATFLSSCFVLAYFLWLIHKNRDDSVLQYTRQSTTYLWECFKQISQVGLPSSLQYLLTVVAVAAQAFFVSKYCAEAVAALGVVKRLDYLPLYFTIGLSQGLLPLLAYNHAAGNVERRKAIFRYGTRVSIFFSLLCFAAYELFAPQIALVFISEPVTAGYIADFVRCMVVAMPFMAFCYPMIIQFQAMKAVKPALYCSILRKGVLDLPLLFLFDAMLPLYGCMWVQPVVDFLSAIVAILFYMHINRRQLSQ